MDSASLTMSAGGSYDQLCRTNRDEPAPAISFHGSTFPPPRLFAGQVYVWPQKLEPPFVAVPLGPSASNLTQDLYITVDCAVLLLSALFLSQARLNPNRVLNAYLVSGYASVAFVFGNS